MDPEDRAYLTRVWPYLLAVALLCVASITLGRFCSVKHEPGYRVSAVTHDVVIYSRSWLEPGLDCSGPKHIGLDRLS